MKITVSTLGKFVLLYMAEELEKMGHLHRVLTNLYSGKSRWLKLFRNDSETVSPALCRVFPLMELFRLGRVVPEGGLSERIALLQCETFDRWASRQIEGSDAVLARSQVALHTFRRARSQGALTVLFRGSAHIGAQEKLLKDEYARHGLPFAINPFLKEREMKEYECADGIMIPSTFARRTFLEAGILGRRLIVSQHGVSTREFHPASVPIRQKVLFVGGVSLQKGVPYLAQAAGKLGLGEDDLHLVGAMDLTCESILKKQGARYTHHSPLGRAQVREIYQSSRVLVLPSIQDGFGLVILEALACGCPVIATGNTGGPDVIADGKNGYIVPPGDADALADRIDRILSDPRREARMRVQAVRSAAAFTWRNATLKLVNGIRRLSAHA